MSSSGSGAAADRLDVLIEVGTEEIPDRFIDDGLAELHRRFESLLAEERLEGATVSTLGTPRRLVVRLDGVPARQEDRTERVVGPPVSVAFDAEGRPTKAAEGFARKAGVDASALTRVDSDKGERVAAVVDVPGRSLEELLAERAPQLFATLPWPKNMRWGSGEHLWVRPVHWILALAGDEVVPLELFGVRSGRTTRGHRTQSEGEHEVRSVSTYADVLREHHVVVDREERRAIIEKGLEQAASALGGRAVEDPGLVALTSDLVEWPVVVTGRFPEDYLELPAVVVRTAMRDHQRFFAVFEEGGAAPAGSSAKLLPAFLHVAGQEDPDGTIAKNNASVLVARLDDARFYWTKDLERPLTERTGELESVQFQERLGSYADKCRRMEELARSLVEGRAGAAGTACDGEAVLRAVQLAKVDQTTEMVKEFTSLEGLMGGLYLRREGVSEAACRAVEEHYLPRWLDDALPQTIEGALLSVVDRTDTLVGCFGVGLVPSGSKDPFALRRAGQGLVAVLLGCDLDLSVPDLLEASADTMGAVQGFERQRVSGDLLPWLEDRVRFVLGEAGLAREDGTRERFAHDELAAVLGSSWTSLPDVLRRLRALAAVRSAERREDLEALSVAFKRVRNIVRDQPDSSLEEERLVEPAEKALATRLRETMESAGPRMEAGEHLRALEEMAALRPEVDRFFDEVLVMAEDESLRRNRLALLQQVERLFLQVADISRIVVAGGDESRSG